MATDVMGMLTSGIGLAIEKARIHDDISTLVLMSETKSFMKRILWNKYALSILCPFQIGFNAVFTHSSFFQVRLCPKWKYWATYR